MKWVLVFIIAQYHGPAVEKIGYFSSAKECQAAYKLISQSALKTDYIYERRLAGACLEVIP